MRGRICGTGSYIPEHYYDNNDLSKMVETNDEWIRERTGIVRRHIAEEDTTVSMAVKAAQNALADAKLNADDLDLILVSTITPNTVIPSTACEVQKELQAANATCFDISAACSGFVYAYNTAQAYISAGMYRNILVIGSETLSGIVNWQDRGSCILFGDGAGAVVLEGDDSPFVSALGADGDGVNALFARKPDNSNPFLKEQRTLSEADGFPESKPGMIRMAGQAVYKFAVTGEICGGAPCRQIKTRYTRRVNERERAGATFEEIEELTVGSLRRAVKDGDKENGSFMCGEIAGLVKELRPCAKILEDIFTEGEEVMKARLSLIK